MSKKDANVFLDKIATDNKYKSELAAIKNPSDLEKMKEKHGLHFTKEEFREAFKEKYHRPFTPEELNKVVAAGGSGSTGDGVKKFFSL